MIFPSLCLARLEVKNFICWSSIELFHHRLRDFYQTNTDQKTISKSFGRSSNLPKKQRKRGNNGMNFCISCLQIFETLTIRERTKPLGDLCKKQRGPQHDFVSSLTIHNNALTFDLRTVQWFPCNQIHFTSKVGMFKSANSNFGIGTARSVLNRGSRSVYPSNTGSK